MILLAQNRRSLPLLLLLLIPVGVFFRSYFVTLSALSPPRTILSGKGDKKNLKHESNATTFTHSGVLDESTEGAPRLSQVSMQYGGNFDLTYERGLRTHVRYGEKWGYPTHYLRQDIIGHDEGSSGMYNKLLYLLTIMVNEQTKPFGKRSEWLAWFDADTVCTNDNVPWSVFLPPAEGDLFHDIHLLVSKDWIGFNAGTFIIRVCEWSINALSSAIALPRLRPEIDLPFNEQDALKFIFNLPENKKHRIYQPRHWWNQYDEYYANMGEKVMRGVIQLHFPGMGGARTNAMGHWFDKIDNKPEEVMIPLKNTSYPSEIEAYWSRVRSAAEMLSKTEEYKKKLKEEHYDVYVADGGKIPDRLGNAEKELHEAIEEEAYDKQKLREKVLALDKAVREAKKDASDIMERKQREEEERKKKEEDEKRQREEEEKRKEEERKRKEEERKRKEEERKRKEEERKKQMEKAAAGEAAEDGDSQNDSEGGESTTSENSGTTKAGVPSSGSKKTTAQKSTGDDEKTSDSDSSDSSKDAEKDGKTAKKPATTKSKEGTSKSDKSGGGTGVDPDTAEKKDQEATAEVKKKQKQDEETAKEKEREKVKKAAEKKDGAEAEEQSKR